jgi:hypothetical protein
MNLNISAQGHYKKKNQLKITLISGPHVHKKSRDQYKIDRFGAFSAIGGQARDKFLEFKNKLYRLYLDEGFSLTFTYLNQEVLVV